MKDSYQLTSLKTLTQKTTVERNRFDYGKFRRYLGQSLGWQVDTFYQMSLVFAMFKYLQIPEKNLASFIIRRSDVEK